MNNDVNHSRKNTTTDSLLGMALAQVFIGATFGAAAATLWEAGEMASAIYTDRFEAKHKIGSQTRTNGRNSFDLGVKNSLGQIFAGVRQSVAEMDRETFTPSFKLSSPSFSAPSFA